MLDKPSKFVKDFNPVTLDLIVKTILLGCVKPQSHKFKQDFLFFVDRIGPWIERTNFKLPNVYHDCEEDQWTEDEEEGGLVVFNVTQKIHSWIM